MPRPKRRGLGRGRGSEQDWSDEAVGQLLSLCEFRQRHRSLADIGLLLWARGFEIELGLVRRAILDHLGSLDSGVARLVAAANGTATTGLSSAAAKLARRRQKSITRMLPDRADREHFIGYFLGALQGQPKAAAPSIPKLILSALGIEVQTLNAELASSIVNDDMTEYSRALHLGPMRRAVASADPAALELARNAVLTIRGLLEWLFLQLDAIDPTKSGQRAEIVRLFAEFTPATLSFSVGILASLIKSGGLTPDQLRALPQLPNLNTGR